jgi:hypothetical protein
MSQGYRILATLAAVSLGAIVALYFVALESNGVDQVVPAGGRAGAPTPNRNVGAQGEETNASMFGSCEETEDGHACGDIFVEVPAGYFEQEPSIAYGDVFASFQNAYSRAAKDLADRLDIKPDAINSIGDRELTNWPDTCLGIAEPEMACADRITPGFRMFLEANDRIYEYHTDGGSRVVLVE